MKSHVVPRHRLRTLNFEPDQHPMNHPHLLQALPRQLDLPVAMIDGIYFRDWVILVVLGVDHQGNKHVLGVRKGSTESTRVVRSLLSELIERGLDAWPGSAGNSPDPCAMRRRSCSRLRQCKGDAKRHEQPAAPAPCTNAPHRTFESKG